jgi:flagellar hook-associated protein 1 FlgK
LSNELLGIGKSGLGAAKRNLATTSHNIANANTEGFSRQRAELVAYKPQGQGNIVIGKGVDVKSVRRIHDELIEKKVRSNTSEHNYNIERSWQLNQAEEIFNEINGEGMNKLLNNFFNNFRELSNQPENDSIRSIVRDSAQTVTRDFGRISNSIKEIQHSIDKKIVASVDEVNTLAENIAKLNVEISQIEIVHGETGDLRDQRDLAVKSLSEFFDIESYENERGQFVINAPGVGSIVVGSETLKMTAAPLKDNTDPDMDGKVEIFFQSRPGHRIGPKFESGKLAALVETRNVEVMGMKKKMDQMAYQLSQAVNAIHRKGYINKMLPVDENGQVKNDGSVEKITGIDFFKNLDRVHDAAEKLSLSQLVQDDPIYIATALEANSPGDNRVALAITKLQHEKLNHQGTATFEEDYLKMVGSLGGSAAKSKVLEEQSKGILAQSTSLKERVSGVSLDEEAANMIRFQHQYQAAAKVISASEEMFDAILNMKR